MTLNLLVGLASAERVSSYSESRMLFLEGVDLSTEDGMRCFMVR